MRRPGKALSRLELLERGVGHGVRDPLERRRRVRALPSREDRPAVRLRLPRDRARRRLSAARVRVMLKRIPIRWRLAVAFAASMAALLVGLGAFVYSAWTTRSGGRSTRRCARRRRSRSPTRGRARCSTPTPDSRGWSPRSSTRTGEIVRSDPPSLSGLTPPSAHGGTAGREVLDDDPPARANGAGGARWRSPRYGCARRRTPAPSAEETLSHLFRGLLVGGAGRTAARDARAAISSRPRHYVRSSPCGAARA